MEFRSEMELRIDLVDNGELDGDGVRARRVVRWR